MPTDHQQSSRRVVLAMLAAALIVAAASLFALRNDALRVDPGSMAVLPVSNQVGREELDWVRLGLMSLMQRMFDENGVVAVPDSAVISAVGDARLDARLALARGDTTRAREVMEKLRRSAGEAWNAEDEALLAELRR